MCVGLADAQLSVRAPCVISNNILDGAIEVCTKAIRGEIATREEPEAVVKKK